MAKRHEDAIKDGKKHMKRCSILFVIVQSPNSVWLCATPWTATCQTSLSLIISQSLPKFMSIASVMPSSRLILWSPLLLLPSFSPQHQGLFQRVGCSHQVTKILELQLQHQSFQWVFRVDFPSDWLIWPPCCLRDSQEPSSAPQLERINSLALCLLYGPALTTVPDRWEDHSPNYMDLCQQSNVSASQHSV